MVSYVSVFPGKILSCNRLVRKHLRKMPWFDGLPPKYVTDHSNTNKNMTLVSHDILQFPV